MNKQRKTYIYGHGKEGYVERYVHIWKSTDKDNCHMCRSMTGFLHDHDVPKSTHKKMDPLCEHNLKIHLASGKHWKHIGEHY
jgi:hypothetical protein